MLSLRKTMFLSYILIFTSSINSFAQSNTSSLYQNKDVKQRILNFLEEDNIDNLKQQKPNFELPKINLTEDILVVKLRKKLPLNRTKDSISVNVIFSLEGELIRIESVQKMEEHDPWRKTVKDYEKSLQYGNTKMNGIGKLNKEITIDTILTWVCKYYRLEEAKEFSISLFDFKFLHKEESIDTLMVKAWGLNNPMPILHNLPAMQINRVRAFFNLEGKLITQSNFL